MPRHLRQISEITPQSRHWTVKVQVIEKGFPRNSFSSNPKKYQRFTLVDSQGTRVQASVFGHDIALFEKSLLVLKDYYISNAIVRPIPADLKDATHQFQWTINNRTLVEEVLDNDGPAIEAKFSFVPFPDLRKYIDSMSQVDIIGVVLNHFPPKHLQTKNGSSTIQELLIVNEELNPLLLTMWDHFVSNECVAISNISEPWPLIVGLRLKVVSFNGLSLSTKLSSSFLFNPDIPEAMPLRAWVTENENHLQMIKAERASLPSIANLVIPKPEDIVLLSTIQSPLINGTFWVEAAATITNLDQNFWYKSCNKCNKSISAEYERVFTCINCQQQGAVAQPRCRFDVELRDGSGAIEATVFGKNAEKLFPFTATDLMEKTNEDGLIDMESFKQLSSSNKHLMLLKPYQFEAREEVRQKINVISVQDLVVESTTTITG